MTLFILLTLIVVANLVLGVFAAGQMGIGPGLTEILKWQPDFRFGQNLFDRRSLKPVRIKPAVHVELLKFNRHQLERFSEYQCSYVPSVTSILDQINASVSKLPWVASELEYYCRILDGRYYNKTVEQADINLHVKNANDAIARFCELFDTVKKLKDCPRALVWIWDTNERFVTRFSKGVQAFFKENGNQPVWIKQFGELTKALCELSDSLQVNWRLAIVKCYESKPYGQNWAHELFHDPVYHNKNIASALQAAVDDRPMQRTVAIVEIDGLNELNIAYGRPVTEAVLHYFQEHVQNLVKKTVAVTTISNSRYMLDVRTLQTNEFTEEVEKLRANIAQSKISIGPHVLNLRATATIAQIDDDTPISTAVSKLRLLHEQTKSTEGNKSCFHSEQSVNPLAIASIGEPITHKLVNSK